MNTCFRYQISSLAYAVAVASLKTPAYVELYDRIVFDAVGRMVDVVAWKYVEEFPEFVAQPTFPDPVAYKVVRREPCGCPALLDAAHLSSDNH